MNKCMICMNPAKELLPLKAGRYVCLNCKRRAELDFPNIGGRITDLRSEIASLTPRHDGRIVASLVFGLVVSIWAWGSWSFAHCVLLGFVAFVLSHSFLLWWFRQEDEREEKDRAAETEKLRAQISRLEGERGIMRSRAADAYVYWPEVPPDWSDRREKVAEAAKFRCEECGRSFVRSRVPFHVHHKKLQAHGGTHALSNLQWLCEICHSKLPHHELVMNARKKRLNEARKRKH